MSLSDAVSEGCGGQRQRGSPAQLIVFPDCVIPGCRNPVEDHGSACTTCIAAFGPHLRSTLGARMTAEQIEERDSYVHRAYALQRSVGR